MVWSPISILINVIMMCMDMIVVCMIVMIMSRMLIVMIMPRMIILMQLMIIRMMVQWSTKILTIVNFIASLFEYAPMYRFVTTMLKLYLNYMVIFIAW